MKKRLVPFLVLALALIIAPAAFANHCERCAAWGECKFVANYGFQDCYVDAGGCHMAFNCGPHAAPVEPLGSEFTVASVERLDEPQAAASETLVATLETPAPATR